MIYSQQYQDSQFSEQLLTNHHPKPTLLYCTPPPSPMANNLGHPNRSCVSCKKRKVKCDRKTPSCAACLKSKHRCQYTSYSPPEEPLPSVQDEETMRQQHWIQNQRMNQELKLQPMVIKNEYDYFNDNSLLGMNIENLVPNSQYAPIRYQPQQLAQLQQNLAQQPYILQQQCQQIPQSSPLMNRNIYNSVIQPVSPVIDNNNCMRATITLNYNLNGLAQMAQQMTDPLMIQYLQSVTKGAGPSLPPNGFVNVSQLQVNVSQLQFWIYEKILALSQEWICDPEQPYVFDPEEKLKLRLIDEQQGQFSYVIRQQFDVVIDRAEYNSGDGFDHQNGDYKPFDDLNQYDDDRHSENSNRSSIDLDSTDIFLQKIYAFVRKFMKDVPWLRENFLKNHSPFLYSPQQNRPSYPVNNDMYDSQNDIVKGRLCF
ncbi:29055_t:CDS:2 [Gigaspora margarita]|uniref:29055_t:CDS:1 n=1 Tax=Gigaspora margarita TaxID=4874 RepID=A0ABN7VMY7_GIGMA|nr:29055_t:CDS:2 [Gigaspora margarita]